MRRYGSKKANSARRRPALRRVFGLERLEKKAMLAADFQVVTAGNEIFVEARGDIFDDKFILTHVTNNEVQIQIDFQIDQDSNGVADGVDTLIEVFDIAQLEFNAALQGRSFTGFRINQSAAVNSPLPGADGTAGNDIIDAGGLAGLGIMAPIGTGMLKNYDDLQFTFNGGAGNDTIGGGLRGDVINGGDGNDKIFNADSNDIISGGAGTDRVEYGPHSFGAQDNDIPLDDVEEIVGTGFNDTIDQSGNPNPVTIIGGGGNDNLSGGSGADSINGGAGNDVINGNGGNDTLLGDAGDDIINGGDGNDTIVGGDGNDTVQGGAGADTVLGGLGNDQLGGGDGNDTLLGEAGNDSLNGGAGDDTLRGGDGDDSFVGGPGNDLIDGGETGETNGDTVDYSGSTGPVTVNLTTGTATGDGTDTFVGPAGDSTIENVIGSNNAIGDTIFGDADDNRIEGRDGPDTIFGRSGNDTLLGEAGNDIIGKTPGTSLTGPGTPVPDAADVENEMESGNDLVDGGDGNDILRGGAGDDMILGGEGNDFIEGDGWLRANNNVLGAPNTMGVRTPYSHIASGNDSIDAGNGDDTVFASDEADPFDGDGGFTDPTAAGYSPGNTIPNNAAPGLDFVDGGGGNDNLYGHAGVDNLLGDDGFLELGNDNLFGLLGDDLLSGGNGADLLVGGEGSDMLIGGTGALDGSDTLRIEATGSGGGASLADTVVITGSPLADLIQVKGLMPFDVVGQSIVEDLLDDGGFPPGIVSDYEPGHDTLDFVAGFSDFLP